MSDRKGFNFYRSYYDVFNMLQNNKDKVDFINAIFDKQFFGANPDLEKVSPMVKMAYISQKHSLDKSIKGYEDKTKTTLQLPLERTSKGYSKPLERTLEQLELEEQLQEKEKGETIIFPFTSKNFYEHWNRWTEYKKVEHRFNYKSNTSIQAALMDLNTKSKQDENVACKIIMQSIANGWKGFFELKNNNNGTDHAQQTANSVERLINKYRAEAEQEIGNA